MLPRIYLDNAASSWPKPESVYSTVDQYQRRSGAPAGRSPYAEAVEVTARIEAVRTSCARLFGIRKPAQLVFTSSGTDGLNLAIHGLLRPGDRVVTSAAEHNSVLRPLADLDERGQIQVARVGCDATGLVHPEDVRRALAPRTRLVALTHASNVTGTVQPIREIAAIAHHAGALLLVDAAQTAGHLSIDVEQLGIDLLATSGHKGLLGPLGTGLVYIRPGLEAEVACTRQGGTGTLSDADRQPATMPDKYESGNLNVPGILGLGAGVEYLLLEGVQLLERHVLARAEQLLAGLSEIRGVRLYGTPGRGALAGTERAATQRVGVVSITIEGYDPQEIAAVLDLSFRIQVRPGLHCAPHMHRSLGTLDRGGTVRFSLGHFTTSEEIDAALAATRDLAASA